MGSGNFSVWNFGAGNVKDGNFGASILGASSLGVVIPYWEQSPYPPPVDKVGGGKNGDFSGQIMAYFSSF